MRSLNFSRLRGVRGVKRTRERRCDQLKSTQHFIPQSLQRGDLVMTTGGQHLFESLCIDHLQRHGASKKAITRAFDDDVEFQERMAEHIRYMVETIAHHQVDIDSEV
ncbi:TPA: hypothetical protein HIE95_000292 [Escherichia coli]|nr:hypothetical protein [Escherichia coli]